jgi:hypothetical protein
MKIYKITEASEYLGVSINTLKTIEIGVQNCMGSEYDEGVRRGSCVG